MFERTKNLLNMGGREKRYPDPDEDYESPEDVEDPHTTRDSTKMTAGEFVTKNSVSILSFLFLGIVTIVLTIVYAGTYFATVLANPWVQRILAFAAILSLGYFFGRSTQRSALMNRDELVIYDPDSQEVIRFLGEFRDSENGAQMLFAPIKGYSLWGHSPEYYEIGDLSLELAAQDHRDPSDEVVIGLHPRVCATAVTNTGRKTVQLSAGLEPDPFGREANVQATLPDIAGEGTVTELKDELESVEREVKKLRKENGMLRRQRKDAFEEARKPLSEARKEVKKDIEMLFPFTSGRTTTVNKSNGDNPERNDMDEVRRGLTHDEP